MTKFVVVWRCFNPKVYAVFDTQTEATIYADSLRITLNNAMKNIGLTGDETVDIFEVDHNPPPFPQ